MRDNGPAMPADTPRKLSIVPVAIVLTAVALGVTYYLASKSVEVKQEPGPGEIAPGVPRPRVKSVPPKVEFLGAQAFAGAPINPPAGVKDTKPAEPAPDDAMVVWLKVTATTPLSRETMPRLEIKDAEGRLYSAQPERRQGSDLMVLHLKKGYDKPVNSLDITCKIGDNEVGKWKIDKIPAPTRVLPDDALKGTPLGKVIVAPGRGGRPSVRVEMANAVPAGQGFYLKPVAESFVAFDLKTVESAQVAPKDAANYVGRVALPNAGMNKLAAFDMVAFKGESSTETVTFHSAQLVDRFGQPTIVVDQDEVAKTDKGTEVVLPMQDSGPKRAPKKTHPNAKIKVNLHVTPSENDKYISPIAAAEIVTPDPASLGLEKLDMNLIVQSGGETLKDEGVLTPPVVTIKPGQAGTFKYGPIPNLTLKIQVVRAVLMPKKRIYMPIEKSDTPVDTGGGRGGGGGGAGA